MCFTVTLVCVFVCVSEHVSGVERERSEECSDHISFREESVFLKIALRSLNTLSAAQRRSLSPKCPSVIC